MTTTLPKALTATSTVHLVHTASAVEPGDAPFYATAKKKITELFPATKEFPVEHTNSDPWYLSASEKTRLAQLRAALPGANWLLPIYGGTGCGDIVRRLTPQDVAILKEQQALVTGFSDNTFLINWLYLQHGLRTIHYVNAAGLYDRTTNQLFWDVVTGKVTQLAFHAPGYRWLSSAVPTKPVEGLAIGGNLVTFRDLLDVAAITPDSWQPYILFLEEVGDDAEDIHRQLIALDARGVFKNIRALVIGELNEVPSLGQTKVHQPFETYIESLLHETLTARAAAGDPLYILKVTNFGHAIAGQKIILPIGATCTIQPDTSLSFAGPFVV